MCLLIHPCERIWNAPELCGVGCSSALRGEPRWPLYSLTVHSLWGPSKPKAKLESALVTVVM